jgi:hypothetical protein
MKILKLLSILLGACGAIMLVTGIQRGYYPYTSEGSYFDIASGIVYSEQTTEVLQLCGFFFVAVASITFLFAYKRSNAL